MRYWDTSVLLKLFVEEHDSTFFTALIEEAGAVIHTSELSPLELLRAFWGKRLDGAIVRGAETTLMRRFERQVEMGRIILVPLGTEVGREFEAVLRACYARRRPIRVRTLDALHVASALAWKANEIVCTDVRMREAAGALGMDIYPRESVKWRS
jgi:predicted nucleic acid-binding protein